MSRPHTAEECRQKLLAHIKGIRDWWLNETRAPTTEEKLDGVMFSILVMIDGEAAEMPAFTLMPAPHPDDAEYHADHGENWWPDDVDLSADTDLHHEWTRFNRRDVKARPTITPFTGLGETDE